YRKADYEFIETHVTDTHGFTRTTVIEWPEELSDCIRGIPPPVLSYACPVDGCPTWRPCVTKLPPGCVQWSEVTRTITIGNHGKVHHGKEYERNPAIKALFEQG